MKQGHTLSLLLFLLLIKAIFMAGVIVQSDIGLGPDEAQYWTWSQQIDWGYYSKPPGVAWQIWLGTHLFGNSEVGVRFASILFSFLLALATYFLAIACQMRPKIAFWASLAFALSPLGILSSLLAITDVGLVLFWTLAIIPVAHALSKNQTPNYYLVSLCIICGALFKWPIYLLWLFILTLTPFWKNFYSKDLFIGIILSLLGLFPSVVWNATHEWATFRHVSATLIGGSMSKDEMPLLHGNFWQFLGAQTALLSPILFFLFVLSLFYLIKRWKSAPKQLLFCGFIALSSLVFMSSAAIFQKMQGNWIDFIYPGGFVLLSWYAYEVRSLLKKWLISGVTLSLVLCLMILSIPYIQTHDLLATIYKIPYKYNGFKQNIGWHQLPNILTAAGYDSNQHFLFGDKYQTTSLLSFYGPQQKRAYFLNLLGMRKNQFSFWPSMVEEQEGKIGYFVSIDSVSLSEKERFDRIQYYQFALAKYFKEVHFLGAYPLVHCYDSLEKEALIFQCLKYNGLEPQTRTLY